MNMNSLRWKDCGKPIGLKDNRIDDLRRATEDDSYCNELCQEYSI